MVFSVPNSMNSSPANSESLRWVTLAQKYIKSTFICPLIILCNSHQEVLCEKGRHVRELITVFIQKRKNSLDLLVAGKVQHRSLSAVAQCESLRYKLLGGYVYLFIYLKKLVLCSL